MPEDWFPLHQSCNIQWFLHPLQQMYYWWLLEKSETAVFQVLVAGLTGNEGDRHVRARRKSDAILWIQRHDSPADHQSAESTHADVEAGASKHPEQPHVHRHGVWFLLLLDTLHAAARHRGRRQSAIAGNHHWHPDRAPGGDPRHGFRTVPGAIIHQLRHEEPQLQGRNGSDLGTAGLDQSD